MSTCAFCRAAAVACQQVPVLRPARAMAPRSAPPCAVPAPHPHRTRTAHAPRTRTNLHMHARTHPPTRTHTHARTHACAQRHDATRRNLQPTCTHSCTHATTTTRQHARTHHTHCTDAHTDTYRKPRMHLSTRSRMRRTLCARATPHHAHAERHASPSLPSSLLILPPSLGVGVGVSVGGCRSSVARDACMGKTPTSASGSLVALHSAARGTSASGKCQALRCSRLAREPRAGEWPRLIPEPQYIYTQGC